MKQPPAGNTSTGATARALAFVTLMYLLMVVMGLLGLVPAYLSRRWALAIIKAYIKATLWLLYRLCGTKCEIRGPVPQGPCIVAAKHQAFLDVLLLIHALPAPRFVMKQSLRWVPIVGIYAERLGTIAIDRSARQDAMRRMVDGATTEIGRGGQVVIYPQGTRVAPGHTARYRTGVIRLYTEFDLPLVLAATNTGWFWPRTGLRRTPGRAVVEFLDTIPPGQTDKNLLRRIEDCIEDGAARLAGEAAESIGSGAPGSR